MIKYYQNSILGKFYRAAKTLKKLIFKMKWLRKGKIYLKVHQTQIS